MADYYDRYAAYRKGGAVRKIPFIEIPVSSTDILLRFNKSRMRMDTLSYQYYGDPNYGWLILHANPKLGSLEYNITDGSQLRIPYPLSTAISRYEDGINDHIKLYGW